MKIRTRIAAIVISSAAIISAGSMNMAGAASGPPPVEPAPCASDHGCKGERAEPLPVEAPKSDPASVAAVVEKAEPVVVAKPKAPKPAPIVVEQTPEVVEAPVTRVQCG